MWAQLKDTFWKWPKATHWVPVAANICTTLYLHASFCWQRDSFVWKSTPIFYLHCRTENKEIHFSFRLWSPHHLHQWTQGWKREWSSLVLRRCFRREMIGLRGNKPGTTVITHPWVLPKFPRESKTNRNSGLVVVLEIPETSSCSEPESQEISSIFQTKNYFLSESRSK